MRQLIRSMLQVHPSERASVAELCSHGWVLAGGDLPAAIELPAPISAYQGRVDAGRAGGRLRELAREYRQPMLNALYGLLVGGMLPYHLRFGADAPDAYGVELEGGE